MKKPVEVIHLWKDRKKLPRKVSGEMIDAYTLTNSMIDFFRLRPKKWWEWFLRFPQISRIYVSDSAYYCLSQDHVTITHSEFSNREYRMETYDCDDFSFNAKGVFTNDGYIYLKNWAFGIIWVLIPKMMVGHALNFYVDQNKKIKMFEPQTNEIYDVFPDDYEFYLAII